MKMTEHPPTETTPAPEPAGTELGLDREQVLRLLTIQNLVLLILCFGWLCFFPRPELYASIKLDSTLLWVLPLALGLLTASSLAIVLIPALRQAQAYLDKQIFSHLKPSDGLYVGLLTGVAEELCFRGLLQNAWGILPASLCFGLLHMPSLQYWPYAIWAGLMGLALGGIYLLSDNLLLVMLVHALNNLLAVVLLPQLRRYL